MKGFQYEDTYTYLTFGPYGPWSPWMTSGRFGNFILEYRIRFRPLTLNWITTKSRERCLQAPHDPMDPPGYAWNTFEEVISRTSGSETLQLPFVETRWIFDLHTHDEYPAVGFVVLPAMQAGDRFHFDARSSRLASDSHQPKLTLDGTDLGTRGVVRADDLGIGYHHIDVEGRAKGRPFRVQLAVSVVQPIEARFSDPVRELLVDLAEGPIGQSFSLEISNDTEAPVDIDLRAHSMPAGWKVLFASKKSRISIKPWGLAKVDVVAELMNDTGLRDGLVPLTVEVVRVGKRNPGDRVFATCYVKLVPTQPLERVIKANQILRRKHAAKGYPMAMG